MTMAILPAHSAAAAGVISAAQKRISSLTAPLQLDESTASLKRFQAAMDAEPRNRELWLAGGVYTGSMLLRIVPGNQLGIAFTDRIAMGVVIETQQLRIPIVEWPDAEKKLPFAFHGGQFILRLSKGVAGGKLFCIKCGHTFSQEEKSGPRKRLRNGLDGIKVACPECGTAVYLQMRPQPEP